MFHLPRCRPLPVSSLGDHPPHPLCRSRKPELDVSDHPSHSTSTSLSVDPSVLRGTTSPVSYVEVGKGDRPSKSRIRDLGSSSGSPDGGGSLQSVGSCGTKENKGPSQTKEHSPFPRQFPGPRFRDETEFVSLRRIKRGGWGGGRSSSCLQGLNVKTPRPTRNMSEDPVTDLNTPPLHRGTGGDLGLLTYSGWAWCVFPTITDFLCHPRPARLGTHRHQLPSPGLCVRRPLPLPECPCQTSHPVPHPTRDPQVSFPDSPQD